MEVDTDADLNLHAASTESGVKYGTLRTWTHLDLLQGPLRTKVLHGHTTTTLADIEVFAHGHPHFPAVKKFEADRAARAAGTADQRVLDDLARTLGNEPLLTDLQRDLLGAVIRRVGSGTPLSDAEVVLHRDLLTVVGVLRRDGDSGGLTVRVRVADVPTR